MATQATDKRQRLVEAGRAMIYRQGYASTTLAEIAAAAGIPLGNVYYYFRSKDALAAAVIETRVAEVKEALAAAERIAAPAERILSLLNRFRTMREEVARYGCPYGSLAQELEKGDGPLGQLAAEPIRLQRAWFAEQLHRMGRERDADALALELVAATQGATLVAHALREPAIVDERFTAIGAWVRSLARGRRHKPQNPNNMKTHE